MKLSRETQVRLLRELLARGATPRKASDTHPVVLWSVSLFFTLLGLYVFANI